MLRMQKKTSLSALAGAAVVSVVGLATDAQASGYTYTLNPCLGAITAANASTHWTEGYCYMAHTSSTLDGFELPLPVHFSGEAVPPTSATYIDDLEVGYYTAASGSVTIHMQITGQDETGQTLYGGTVYEGSTTNFATGNTFDYPGSAVEIPAGGTAYVFFEASGTVTIVGFNYDSRTS